MRFTKSAIFIHLPKFFVTFRFINIQNGTFCLSHAESLYLFTSHCRYTSCLLSSVKSYMSPLLSMYFSGTPLVRMDFDDVNHIHSAVSENDRASRGI